MIIVFVMVSILLINYIVLHKIATTQADIDSIFIPKTVQATIGYVQRNSACLTNSRVIANKIISASSQELNSDLGIFEAKILTEENRRDASELIDSSVFETNLHNLKKLRNLNTNRFSGNFKFQVIEDDPWNTPRSCKSRSAEIEMRRSLRSRPLILFYDAFFGNEYGTLEDVYMKYFNEFGQPFLEKPSCFTCESTTNRSLFEEASIVMFHLPDLANIPQKYCGQYFALMTLEAPPYYDTVDPVRSLTQSYNKRMLEYFDISSTYRLDSDVPLPHFTFWYEHKLLDALLKPALVPIKKRDSKYPVVWIASKCDTSNNRYGYVKELMKYIGVKSYGKCLHNADIPKDSSYDIEATKAIAQHKFHLSFENSNCDYYVTEKLTRTFELGVIPVIMGAPQIADYLPSNQSSILVNDFVSPKELAHKLQEINANNELFESYLKYKHGREFISPQFWERWIQQHRHRICKLCDIATNKITRSQLKGFSLDLSCEV